MNIDQEMFKRKLLLAQICAVGLFFSNLFFLVIPQYLKFPPMDPTANLLMLRILLIVALVYPLLMPIMRNAQIKIVKKGKQSPPDAFFNHMLIQLCSASFSFVLGFIVYLVAHNFNWMLYFYPIGLVWTLIYFPRKSMMTNFIERLQAP